MQPTRDAPSKTIRIQIAGPLEGRWAAIVDPCGERRLAKSHVVPK